MAAAPVRARDRALVAPAPRPARDGRSRPWIAPEDDPPSARRRRAAHAHELRERVEREGIALDSSTGLHIIGLAVTSGLAIQGPDRGKQPCLVLREDWLPPSRGPHDRDAALRELARRYLRAFGPATEVDFAGWAGLPLRDVRVGLDGIASELRELRLGGANGLRAEAAGAASRRPVSACSPPSTPS